MEEVIFEDYNIRITEEDLKCVNKKTLAQCKQRLKQTLSKLKD